ncbi:DNA-binding NarL/FixJ family response regulator [Rhodococcus sp. LBL1]|nr:DNA-binding NarL/FixJ family response regulator [Rhodococcus sp. LBL1]MDH6682179.1 DNA-binding NarL/FixJ family response regulator [Rhodococcus sp. LBL2]
MTDAGPITVLIVDDDPFVRRGVADIFRAAPDILVVGDASDGDEVLAAVRTFRPHVVLMDLKMKRVGGLEATRMLMESSNPPKVVAMTSMDVDDLVVKSVAAGAHSFLSKDEPPHTFHQSVRVVAAGNTLFSPESLRRIVAAGGAIRESGPDLSRLTDRERDVLAVLAEGEPNADIGRRLFMSETTVKSHVSAILAKLGARNRVEAALSAFRAGLVV